MAGARGLQWGACWRTGTGLRPVSCGSIPQPSNFQHNGRRADVMTDSITAESIARGLDKARRNGAGWRACCPAHDDNNPSLDITDGNGKVLVNCRSGCSQEAVIAALRSLGCGTNRIPFPFPTLRPGRHRDLVPHVPYRATSPAVSAGRRMARTGGRTGEGGINPVLSAQTRLMT